MDGHASGATDTASAPVLDVDGARATIRLNRPRHLNRLQPEDLAALTMEASALAMVPLAGSQHTVGRPDMTRY